MYNISILFFTIIASLLIANNKQSIHQFELEYYNKHYIVDDNQDTEISISRKRENIKSLSHEVFGYHPYWMGTSWQNYNFDLISTIAFFSAEANSTGGFDDLHGWPPISLINKAHSTGTNVVLCVSLFNSDDIKTLLSSQQYRQNLINNLITQVKLGNADGVNIDFESFPASQKENMVTFITDLTDRFHSEIPGSQVTLALPAVDWSNAWDYNSLALNSDGLFIMGYDYHWSGSSTTGAVAPLAGSGYNVTWTVLDYLSKTNNQSEKIILGVPYYGYQWETIGNFPGAQTLGSATVKTYPQAEALALTNGKQWDNASQTPWYFYQDNNWIQGWYDDRQSLSLKYDLALNYNLKGVGMWALGYDGSDSQLWDLLNEKFGGISPPQTPTNMFIKNIGDGSIIIDFNGASTANEFIVIREFLDSNKQNDTIGVYVEKPIILNNLIKGEAYYLNVTAKNDYGSSNKTETLGVVPSLNPISCLIVNGFDRTIGTNNTFDYIKQHGSSVLESGYEFDSASNEAIVNSDISLDNYIYVDWILGEEGDGTSTLTSLEQNKLMSYLEKGRFLFISGSEIGYDLVAKGNDEDKNFYQEYLKANYIADDVGSTYNAYGIPNSIANNFNNITFDNGTHGSYNVDYPDGITPANNSEICIKYTNIDYNTKGGMGIHYKGTFGNGTNIGGLVYLAVGFESIYPESIRDSLMADIMGSYEGQLDILETNNINFPQSLEINSIYPNPFNSSLTVIFTTFLQNNKHNIIITDISGREIKKQQIQIINNRTTWSWNGQDNNGNIVTTGIYFITIDNGKYYQTRKVTLLK